MTGQEKGDLLIKYRQLLNRGDHLGRFDCTCLIKHIEDILRIQKSTADI